MQLGKVRIVNQNQGRMKKDNAKSIQLAAALAYNVNDNAPRIVAQGRGVVAKNIIERAEDAGVPVVNNPEAAAILNTLNIGDEIPYELYQVVAQILAYVAKIDKDYAGRHRVPQTQYPYEFK